MSYLVGCLRTQGFVKASVHAIHDLLGPEMDTNGDFTIHSIISLHLQLKRPSLKGFQGNLDQLMMRCRLKDNHNGFPIFVNQESGLKPIT